MMKTMKVIFIVFFVYLGTLFFREQRIPRVWVDRVTDRFSTSNLVVRCEGASFGFKRGLHVQSLKVFDRNKTDWLEPVVAARSVTVDPLARTVRVVDGRYPRLPESYYHGECRERNERLELELPRIPEFRLILERPDVLGLTPDRLTAQVNVRRKWFNIDDIHIDWQHEAHSMKIDGMFRFDLVSQTAHGEVRGHSFPQLIRPLLVVLDVPTALQYMDAFTELPSPVPAKGDFDVNLVNGDFKMKLGLRPEMGRYNGVPMARAEGILDLYAYTRGTNCNANFSVDLPLAMDREGKNFAGRLDIRMTNDLVRLAYDVKSAVGFKEALEIVDFISPSTLDMVVCETKPQITVKGTSGISVEDAGHNDIAFTAKLARGSFMGLQLRDAETEFRLVKDRLDFSRIEARGRTGGRLSGTAWLSFPDFDEEKTAFGMKLSCKGGSLEEMSDLLHFDLGERDGSVEGWCELTGPVSTNGVAGLNGRGMVRITDGHLAQMKLFAGLTKQLAEKVPGVGFLVNQSQASSDYTISNGVFRSENVFIEGGLISLKGWGSYDIPKDNLDFTVRIQFLKNDSLLGKVIHPVTWPFTKLLLEFRATGPVDDPKWDYISILDRIL